MRLPHKIYAIDTGLINAIGVSITEDLGRAIENIVALKLLRSSDLFIRFKVFYWKDQNSEIDFVVMDKLKVSQLIQVSYSLNAEKTRKREYNSLANAAELTKCNDLLLITWDEEGIAEYDGKTIKIIPLWKWLLEHYNGK